MITVMMTTKVVAWTSLRLGNVTFRISLRTSERKLLMRSGNCLSLATRLSSSRVMVAALAIEILLSLLHFEGSELRSAPLRSARANRRSLRVSPTSRAPSFALRPYALLALTGARSAFHPLRGLRASLCALTLCSRQPALAPRFTHFEGSELRYALTLCSRQPALRSTFHLCLSLPPATFAGRSIRTSQDLAGAEGFEPPSPVLETGSLAVELTPLKSAL